MHLALCILAGLIILTIGMAAIAFFSHREGPDEEQELGKIRHMYPDDDPEYTLGEDNTPDWKIGKVRNN